MTETITKNYPNIAQSFGIAGILIVGMLVFFPINIFLNNFIGKEGSLLLYSLLATGVPFVIAYSIRKKKTGVSTFNLNIKNTRTIPFVIMATFGFLIGIISPLSSIIPMPELMKKAFMDMMGEERGVFAFVTMVIAAPILEELIFRGIILDGLLYKHTPLKSILISSFLFGIVHLNPWQFVTGFVLGIFSGWVYYKTKSLTLSIIIHAAANSVAFILQFIGFESSIDETLIETYGGWTNLVMVILGSLALVLGCIYFLKREFIKIID